MRRVLYCLPGHVKTEYQDLEHYKVNGEDIIERLVAHERRHTGRSCVIVQGIYSGIHLPGGFSGITFPLGCSFLVVIRPSGEDEGALVESGVKYCQLLRLGDCSISLPYRQSIDTQQ